MVEDKSIDLTGIGKVAKAIPQKAWIQVVDTACAVFKESLAPLTATTSGLGRLIEAKFERLTEAEKIIAAQNLAKAKEKIDKSGRNIRGRAQAKVVVRVIEESSCETEATLSELWQNLLSNEILEGDTHPDFVRILSSLSASEAQLLIWATTPKKEREKRKPDTNFKFNQEHLISLGIVHGQSITGAMTEVGKTFMRAVKDPSVLK